ncbi:hypothetical protein [Streptomyces sp. NPDC020298]|uniref:hypothetical protein n=1 Tax=unclassified Streptomyces TaxID=2593676 RepID=UPI0033D80588
MIEQIAVGAAVLVAGLTGVTRGVMASWPAPTLGRHRASGTVPLDDLLGPPSPYTTPGFADVPVSGVVVQAWRPCSGPCGQEMPSVLHADGTWQCGHCLTVSGGAA